MGKSSKEDKAAVVAAAEVEEEAISYEMRLAAVNEIALPLASKKLTKKMLKSVKKAAKSKTCKRGVKEVVKGLRKGCKGMVIIAGDIQPIDVITHLPVLCEDSGVPYIYVPSKEDLGLAGSTKRPTSCVLIQVPADGKDKAAYEEVLGEVSALNATLITV